MQMRRFNFPRLCAIAVGLIFIWASVHKLMNPADFALSIFRYHIVPHTLINPAALVLPWLELLCGICAVGVPKMRKPALLILLALLIVFTGAIVINLLRGTTLACGCFTVSPLARPLSWMNVLRNLGIITLATIALLPQKRA
jgi:hypothetical protein